jgi:hypothetical protein
LPIAVQAGELDRCQQNTGSVQNILGYPTFFSRDTSSDLTYTPVGDSKAALYHDAATPKETDQTC